MSELNEKELRTNYIKRYALALFLIATLSTLAFTGLILALKDADNSAFLVNISGKQRMLSQTIALDAYRICELKQQLNGKDQQDVAQKISIIGSRLTRHINEMSLANQQLSTGRFINQPHVEVSDELTELYFGAQQLAQQVDEYLALATQIVPLKSNAENRDKLNHLSEISLSLVVDLDKAVRIYQKEGEQKLHIVKIVESFVWLITIVVLLFEVIFIFQPLVRKVASFATKMESYTRELEYQVEYRTLKLEKLNQSLIDLAYHDALTGLQNRLNLEQDIERITQQFEKYRTPFAVLMIDIDWFKAVNDSYGHDAGDFVLKEVADLLLGSVRQKDYVYRAGGEEFVILFESLSLEEAQQKAEEVRQKVENHAFTYNEIQIKKTVSIGVYHSDLAPAKNVKFILKVVDDALYRSKAVGRNRVSVCQKSATAPLKPSDERESKVVFMRFDQESFIGVNLSKELQKADKCIQPYYVSENVSTLMGVQAHRLIDGEHCVRDFLHPDDFDIVEKFAQTVQQLPEMSNEYRQKTFLWHSSFRILNMVGDVKITHLDVYFIPNENPSSVGSLEAALCESQDVHISFGDALMVYNFHAMLENTNDFIYFKDQYHVFTAASKTLVKITNVKNRAELVGKTDYDVFPKEYADKYFKLEKQIFNREVQMAHELQPILDEDGNQGWVDNRKYPIKDQDDNIIGLFGIARIISDEERQAGLDPSTTEQ